MPHGQGQQAEVQLLHGAADYQAPRRQARLRDFQRSRLYAAEARVPWCYRGRRFDDLDEIQAYALKVTRDPGFCQRFDGHVQDYIVIDKARWNQNRALCYPDGRITFGGDETHEMELLHEITHAALFPGVRHRAEFVDGLYWMLGRFLPKAAMPFRVACQDLKVLPFA